jgi:adenylate kinase family enzyme
MNDLEKGYCTRFHLFDKTHKSFKALKSLFINNSFYKTLEGNSKHNLGRIYLLGGSGVGKSFVSQIMKEASNISVLDLDSIYWKKDTFSMEEDEEVRDKNLLDTINKNKNLVIEGSYIKDWVLPCFENADKIFVIRSNYKLQKRRIICRFIKRKLGIEKTNRKETIKSIRGLISWTRTYNDNMNSFVGCHYDQFKDKIVFVNNSTDILVYLYAL